MFPNRRNSTFNKKRNSGVSWWRVISAVFLASALAWLSFTLASDPDTAQAFCCESYHPFCSSEGHGSILREAFDFINPNIWLYIQGGNTAQDQYHSDERLNHFIGCWFTETTTYINSLYDEILASFDDIPEATMVLTADRFGRLLHTAQDFYAHSGWTDPEPIGLGFGVGRGALIDSGLGYWTVLSPYQILSVSPGHEMVVLEGEPDPTKFTIEIPSESVVPIVTSLSDGKSYPGLITAGSDSACPDVAQFAHGSWDCTDELYAGCFNHDDDDHVRWLEAFNAAISQTEHEWCRLLNLVHDQKGIKGSSLLMSLDVEYDELPNKSPHKLGTACEWNPSGPIEIEVRVTDYETTPLRLYSNGWFVVYTDDFQDSRRTKIDLVSHEPAAPLHRMCLEPTDSLVVSMWGWVDEYSEQTHMPGVYEIWEDILDGVYASYTSADNFGAGSHSVSSNDLRLDYEISLPVHDDDNDGLSYCAENYYGTDIWDADSDDDTLLDGEEINQYGTNPNLLDTDLDGLGDGAEVKGANPTNPLISDTDNDGLLDGVEDADKDGARGLGETDPNDFDSDDDYLGDGIEINGSNPTQPLISDSDGDALLDGVEDVNHNGALDTGETNPNNPDTDGDGLNDGVEVNNGTNPLNPDSDGDGIVDGEDTEWIQNTIREIPVSDFIASGIQDGLLKILDAVEKMVASEKIDQAIRQLEWLPMRLDGCGSSPDSNDWIIVCPEQIQLREFINLLIDNLEE